MKLPSYYCEICGILKGKNANHEKCSKQLQIINKEKLKAKLKDKKSYAYSDKRINNFVKKFVNTTYDY